MTYRQRKILRLGFSCALLAAVMFGAFGMTDRSRAKLPLCAIAGILGCAYFSRPGALS